MVDGCGWGGLSMMDYPDMAYRIIVVLGSHSHGNLKDLF